MEEQKGHVNNLFEDGWFFGNSLLSRSKSSKMVRCNSDPCSSTSTKEDVIMFPQNPSKMSNLLRTPSLPPCFGRDSKYEQEVKDEEEEEEEEEEDEPRMGDLIRQAMPLPCRRLDRAPSLPPCRGKEAFNMAPNIQIGFDEVGKLSRRASIGSSSSFAGEDPLLLKQGPTGMTKLSRRASIDSSMLLPPRCTSKGRKQGASNSKNRQQRKQDLPIINGPSKTEPRDQNLDKSRSQKSVGDPEMEELQGFKDLGFSFDAKEVSPSVAQILPALQRTSSIDSHLNKNLNKIRRPYPSEAWDKRSTSPLNKRADQKPPSTEDVKAHIKFWARAVASNVRQEC